MSSARCFIFSAAFLVVAGCDSGPPSADITGTITYDGKAIEKGYISFFPRNGKGVTAGGEIIDGAYTAKGVPFGEMDVKINATKVTGTRKLYPHDPKSA